MTTQGTVRAWHDEEGWGVVDSAETPGGCWVHFSAVAVPGFRSLAPGQDVELEWERAEQDGYHYRAVRAWPCGQEPYSAPSARQGPSSAYSSTLTIRFPDGTSWTGDGSSAPPELGRGAS